MSYNENLATELRKRGLKVKESVGWKRRGHGPMGAVKGVMVHHTAGPRGGGNMPSLHVLEAGRKGLLGPLANIGLGRDGTVYLVAGGRAYHAGLADNPKRWAGVGIPSGNLHTIGVEIENAGTYQPYPDKQLAALVGLLVALLDIYGLEPQHVLGHKEWAGSRKIDPAGIDMDALRKTLAARDTARADVAKPAPVSTAKNVRRKLAGKLAVDGKLGPKTIAALQSALGLTPTGVLSGYTTQALQRHLGVPRTGRLTDAPTVVALQRRVGAHPDGKLGPKTIAALQLRLSEGRLL